MRVGILGAGGMGGVHARQYRKMAGVELSAYDLDSERLGKLAANWQLEPSRSLDDLLSWADVVDICLPTTVHKDAALRAIAAGRAVFVEKPLARTLEDAREVVESAEKANIPLGVGHVVRYFPEFRSGHDIVARGGIGNPAAARTRRGGAAPSGSDGWFMDHSKSGGVLLDLAIHDFDWLRWTLGEVKHLYSRSVGASTGTGPDYALTVLTFQNGAVAHVESTWMDPSGFRTAYEVCGSEGMIQFDSRETPSLRTHANGKSMLESNLAPTDDPYFKEIDGYLTSVREGTAPPVTGRDGVAALAIALAAVESAQTGKVTVPEV